MNLLRPLELIALVAVSVLLAACEPREWKTPNMSALTPRLQLLFEKTKSVCFGRFMVDVPESATVSWGLSYVPLGITIYLDGYDQVQEEEQKFVDELKNTKAIYLKDIPLFLSEETTSQPPGKIVTGYEGYDAINGLKINGYFKLGMGGFIVNTLPLREHEKSVVKDIQSIAQRLRLRAVGEAPAEPGNCIEYAFLPDEPGGYQEVPSEHVRIGFRLKEFPDTHLSIYVAPSNPYFSEGNSLEWRLGQLEKRQKAEDPNHPLLKTRYFRRGPRQIRDWQNGWEGLSRSPDQTDAHGFHDFALQVRGVPSDLLRPYADIRMQTGVGDNAAGAVKPSLTDEEAVAVWDKITSSIRVRPTTPAPVKASSAGPSPNLPLGTLAATGSVCPQAGWWQSTEAGEVKGGRPQRLKAGEEMPRAVLFGEPSLWQKFRGERPTHRTATVWKLVNYGDAPAVAQAIPEPAADNAAADGVAQGHQ